MFIQLLYPIKKLIERGKTFMNKNKLIIDACRTIDSNILMLDCLSCVENDETKDYLTDLVTEHIYSTLQITRDTLLECANND